MDGTSRFSEADSVFNSRLVASRWPVISSTLCRVLRKAGSASSMFKLIRMLSSLGIIASMAGTMSPTLLMMPF